MLDKKTVARFWAKVNKNKSTRSWLWRNLEMWPTKHRYLQRDLKKYVGRKFKFAKNGNTRGGGGRVVDIICMTNAESRNWLCGSVKLKFLGQTLVLCLPYQFKREVK